MTAFVSQLHVEAPPSDETPSFKAPVNVTPFPVLHSEPVNIAIPVPVVPASIRSATPARRVRRRWALSWPLWPPVRGLTAVAIAGCIATGIGLWLAGWSHAEVAAPRRLAVQTPQRPTPPLQTAQSPRQAVRTPPHPRAVIRTAKKAPVVATAPVPRVPAMRRPLPTPQVVVPQLPSVSLATLARPSALSAVSELPPPPWAIIPPGIVYEELPRPSIRVNQTTSVLLVILINKHGGVDRAFIGSLPVVPWYERQLLAAAKTWRYTPAFQNGRAIPYRKTLRVTLPASRSSG
jgi:hypothetical protein